MSNRQQQIDTLTMTVEEAQDVETSLLVELDQLKRQLADHTAALQFLVDMPFGAPLAFARCQSLARATLKKWQPAPAPAAPSAKE